MKKICSFFMMALSLFSIMGQGPILKKQGPSIELIYKQEKKLIRKFKKTKCYNPLDSLHYLFIFMLEFKDQPNPSLILKQGIMNELFFLYHKNRKFPINSSIIYNQNRKVVGSAERSNVYCYEDLESAHKEDRMLVNYLLEQNPEMIFQISPASSNLYFAKKGRKIIALLFEGYQLKVLSLKEFVDCYWDEYFPKEIIDLYYVH